MKWGQGHRGREGGGCSGRNPALSAFVECLLESRSLAEGRWLVVISPGLLCKAKGREVLGFVPKQVCVILEEVEAMESIM